MKAEEEELLEKLPGFCGLPDFAEREFPADIDPMRESLIRIISNTWVNGTEIHYCFWKSASHGSPASWDGSDADKHVVRDAFQVWKDVGIGLIFIEVDDPYAAEVRIGFEQGGSWSYLGTYVLNIPQNQRTMNFGWQLSGRDYGKATALHEIGHTLGMPHEHQNPNAGLDWNEENVYREFGGPPNNWNRDKIFRNILRTIPVGEVAGSNWDPESIMHYSFRPHLIDAPPPYSEDGIPTSLVLSEKDKEYVERFYPPQDLDEYIELKPFRTHSAILQAGDQVDFIIKPGRSRKYRMQTFGRVDTLLVLFEKSGEENLYLSADDDGGYRTNARIKYRLHKGREYILRLRFYYGDEDGETAVLLT